MNMSVEPDIKISVNDYERLHSVLSRQTKDRSIDLLFDELDRAEILPIKEMPNNVVRMHSEVTFTVSTTEKTCVAQLVYPGENFSNDAISILSPVGSALLGLTVGQSIEWPLSDNKKTMVKIEKVDNTRIA